MDVKYYNVNELSMDISGINEKFLCTEGSQTHS